MKSIIKRALMASAGAMAFAISVSAQAADKVNVAFFLEWATPNQIAKVDKTYDKAMGVGVNWTDFKTGVFERFGSVFWASESFRPCLGLAPLGSFNSHR